MSIKQLLAACGGAFLPILLAVAQVTQPAVPASAPATLPASSTPSGPQLTADDVSAWLDGLLPPAMAIGDIAGAVVVVVKGDRLLVTKGYGLADVEKQTPVSGEKTLFRPGSISKLFT